MFIMAYNDYEAVKLVIATRPNLGFYSRTPAPSRLKNKYFNAYYFNVFEFQRISTIFISTHFKHISTKYFNVFQRISTNYFNVFAR
jgi:hypothetical protein